MLSEISADEVKIFRIRNSPYSMLSQCLNTILPCKRSQKPVHPERSIAQKRKFYASDVCSDELATFLYLPRPLTNQKGQKVGNYACFSSKESCRFLIVIICFDKIADH